MTGETYSEHPCKWCGEPAETCVHVTDITSGARRDYVEYACERCRAIEDRIYAGLEGRFIDVEIDELKRRMRRALRRRGVMT